MRKVVAWELNHVGSWAFAISIYLDDRCSFRSALKFGRIECLGSAFTLGIVSSSTILPFQTLLYFVITCFLYLLFKLFKSPHIRLVLKNVETVYGRISKAFVYSRDIPKYEGICILSSKNVKLMFDIARDSYNRLNSSTILEKLPIYAYSCIVSQPTLYSCTQEILWVCLGWLQMLYATYCFEHYYPLPICKQWIDLITSKNLRQMQGICLASMLLSKASKPYHGQVDTRYLDITRGICGNM